MISPGAAGRGREADEGVAASLEVEQGAAVDLGGEDGRREVGEIELEQAGLVDHAGVVGGAVG